MLKAVTKPEGVRLSPSDPDTILPMCSTLIIAQETKLLGLCSMSNISTMAYV